MNLSLVLLTAQAATHTARRTIARSHLLNGHGAPSVQHSLHALGSAMKSVDTFFKEQVPASFQLRRRKPKALYELRDPSSRPHAEIQQEIVGSKSLLLEIIRRAAYDWVLYRSSRRIMNKRLAEESYIWLFLEGPGHPDWDERMKNGKHITSFVAICEALELDPDTMREHIKRLTAKNVMSVGRPAEYRRIEARGPQEADGGPELPDAHETH
jgi:hypothetical protein